MQPSYVCTCRHARVVDYTVNPPSTVCLLSFHCLLLSLSTYIAWNETTNMHLGSFFSFMHLYTCTYVHLIVHVRTCIHVRSLHLYSLLRSLHECQLQWHWEESLQLHPQAWHTILHTGVATYQRCVSLLPPTHSYMYTCVPLLYSEPNHIRTYTYMCRSPLKITVT